MSANNTSTSPLWPADNPAVTAHVTLLQGIITRLANNSASCKTWCLTLVGALVGLGGATRTPGIVSFSLVPVMIFGFLDAIYLTQERAYRKLYRETIAKIRARNYSIDYVFEAGAPVKVWTVLQAFGSWSIYPVYGGLIVAYLIIRLSGWLGALATIPR